MAIVSVVRTRQAVQYDGTNSADCLTCIGHLMTSTAPQNVQDPTIDSEDNGVLVLKFDDDGASGDPQYFTVNEGDWVVAPEAGYLLGEIFSDDGTVVPLSTLTNP